MALGRLLVPYVRVCTLDGEGHSLHWCFVKSTQRLKISAYELFPALYNWGKLSFLQFSRLYLPVLYNGFYFHSNRKVCKLLFNLPESRSVIQRVGHWPTLCCLIRILFLSLSFFCVLKIVVAFAAFLFRSSVQGDFLSRYLFSIVGTASRPILIKTAMSFSVPEIQSRL